MTVLIPSPRHLHQSSSLALLHLVVERPRVTTSKADHHSSEHGSPMSHVPGSVWFGSLCAPRLAQVGGSSGDVFTGWLVGFAPEKCWVQCRCSRGPSQAPSPGSVLADSTPGTAAVHFLSSLERKQVHVPILSPCQEVAPVA